MIYYFIIPNRRRKCKPFIIIFPYTIIVVYGMIIIDAISQCILPFWRGSPSQTFKNSELFLMTEQEKERQSVHKTFKGEIKKIKELKGFSAKVGYIFDYYTAHIIFIVVTIVFFFVRMIPGDPARMIAGEQATLEDVENVREALGLNLPVGQQYIKYMKGLLHGDLGTSMRTKRPVAEELAVRYPNTVKLTLVAITWSVLVGILLGVWSSRHRSRWQDYLGMTIAVSGISIPNFWIGFMLISLFAVKLHWLPATGAGSFKNLILPGLTLGTNIMAILARFTRSSMIEQLKEDYIRTGRSKGIGETAITWRHAFRNSMISVVTVVGMQFGFLLGGSVITEAVFAYNGIGQLLVTSVSFRDYPCIQSLILIFSLHFIVINFVVDILYAILNPEIQLS